MMAQRPFIAYSHCKRLFRKRVNLAAGGGDRTSRHLRVGHPSGHLAGGAEAITRRRPVTAKKAIHEPQRARILMGKAGSPYPAIGFLTLCGRTFYFSGLPQGRPQVLLSNNFTDWPSKLDLVKGFHYILLADRKTKNGKSAENLRHLSCFFFEKQSGITVQFRYWPRYVRSLSS